MSEQPPTYHAGDDDLPTEAELITVMLYGEHSDAKCAAEELTARIDELRELLAEEQRENEHLRGKLQPTQAEQDEWRRVTARK